MAPVKKPALVRLYIVRALFAVHMETEAPIMKSLLALFCKCEPALHDCMMLKHTILFATHLSCN